MSINGWVNVKLVFFSLFNSTLYPFASNPQHTMSCSHILVSAGFEECSDPTQIVADIAGCTPLQDSTLSLENCQYVSENVFVCLLYIVNLRATNRNQGRF